ncbi:hypothetical protein [Streptomyces sp. NPDC057702]|uniref:hypothetical protein n=1 Tax=unclassified Streptomyces TaxID=2593676 RepID=UPI0036977034
MLRDWEVDAHLLLDIRNDEWPELSEAMLAGMRSAPRYEIVPTATSHSPDGSPFSTGATVRVKAETPGAAVDDAVAATRRALRAAGKGPDNGVVEVNLRQGEVDPRTLGRG